MNILLNKHFFVGFMVSEIPRVSVFGYFPLGRAGHDTQKMYNRYNYNYTLFSNNRYYYNYLNKIIVDTITNTEFS